MKETIKALGEAISKINDQWKLDSVTMTFSEQVFYFSISAKKLPDPVPATSPEGKTETKAEVKGPELPF